MQSEQKRSFCSPAPIMRCRSASFFLRYLLVAAALSFCARRARAMEPVIFLRRSSFQSAFAALLTLFPLFFLLGGLSRCCSRALSPRRPPSSPSPDAARRACLALTGGLLDRLRSTARSVLTGWELLAAELSDWAAYGSTALAGLASRALALLGSMAPAMPALVLFAATTLLAVFPPPPIPRARAAAKRRLSPSRAEAAPLLATA